MFPPMFGMPAKKKTGLSASFLHGDVAKAASRKKLKSGLKAAKVGLGLADDLFGGDDQPDPQAETGAVRALYNEPSSENMDALLQVLGRAGAYRAPHSYFGGS